MRCFMLSKLFSIIALLFLIFSCGSNDKKYDEFFEVYEDILKVRITEVDSIKAQFKIDSILKSRELSQDDFKNLMIDMSKESKDFVPRLEKLRESLLLKRDSLINLK